MAIDMRKLEDLMNWVTDVNKEFERCNGEIHGDARAWHTVYHDPQITNDRVYDWVKACQALHTMDSNIATNYQMSYINDLEVYLNKHWNKPRCFDKGIGRNRHQPAFRAFMEMKDLINRVSGYEPPKPKPVAPDATPFERLFDFK